MSAPLLMVQDLHMHFGGLKAVDAVTFDLHAGEILGLLGPNGAGKTVCFNLISGVYHPTRGSIQLDGKRIDGLAAHEIARMGIGRTFQIVKPFATLSVLENVLVARGIQRYGQLTRIVSGWKGPAEKRAAMAVLAQVGLADLAGRHEEIQQLERLIRDIRDQGRTILLIEHNMRVTMSLCDRMVVLDHGRQIAQGRPHQIQQDTNVIEAYLGRQETQRAASQ